MIDRLVNTVVRSPMSRLCLLLAALVVVKQAGADVPGSTDYAQIQRFSGSQIVDYRVESDNVYSLALGRMQRAAGRVAPSQSERFQGRLSRITYEIPAGFTAQEVFNHFRSQLLTASQRELFSCQGRDCGSSNFWANDVFHNRILYGPEAGQYYMAGTYQSSLNGRQVSGYAALYVVTRANRRLYAHIDFLELPDAVAAEQRASQVLDSQTLLQRLQQDGMAVAPGLGFNENDELSDAQGISLLADLLSAQSQLRIYIVGHLQAETSLQEQLERSRARAGQVREQLISAGIAADRMEAQGVGPLAPFCRTGPCSQRIEILLRP